MTESKNFANECDALFEEQKKHEKHPTTFGGALEQLKAGKRVQRAGWNGKGMWLVLIPADQWSTKRRPEHRLPWIAMKTADDGLVPWLASQTDMLAEDWSVVS